MRLRSRAGLERAVDAAVLGILIVIAIRAETEFTRIAVLIAAVLLLLGWLAAWLRR